MSTALLTPPAPLLTPPTGPSRAPLLTMGQVMAPRSTVRYCALAVDAFGAAEPFLFSKDGRVIVFETLTTAQDFVEYIAEGRDSVWDATGEVCHYQPALFDLGKFNKISIITGYDIYNLPAMHPVPSEVRGMSWKHHTLSGHFLRDVMDAS